MKCFCRWKRRCLANLTESFSNWKQFYSKVFFWQAAVTMIDECQSRLNYNLHFLHGRRERAGLNIHIVAKIFLKTSLDLFEISWENFGAFNLPENSKFQKIEMITKWPCVREIRTFSFFWTNQIVSTVKTIKKLNEKDTF